MAASYKTTLRLEVLGKDQIEKFNTALKNAGLTADGLYEKISRGGAEIRKATYEFDNLNKTAEKAVREAARVSNIGASGQYKAKISETKTLINSAINKDKQYRDYLEKEASLAEKERQKELKNHEAYFTHLNKAYEKAHKDYEREFKKFIKTFEKQERDLTKAIEKAAKERKKVLDRNEKFRSDLRRELNKKADREIYTRSPDEIRAYNRAKFVEIDPAFIKGQVAAQKAMALMEKSAGIISEANEKERIKRLKIVRRQLTEIIEQGREASSAFGGLSIIKIFAFDLLRRTLTNIYQLVNQVGSKITEWVIDGIKFNDELKRSRTFFTALGLVGMKGIAGGPITLAEAKASNDPKIQKAYKQSVDQSAKLMNKLMGVAALTGQDLSEIVQATRQSMTDLINKVSKEGKPSPYLTEPDKFNDVAIRMVKLASSLRMADPQNRLLSFHMVGLQELFSGSTEGKKDSGLANVMSIMRREGLKFGKEYASQITKAVNAGDITKAADIIEGVLSRAGLGIEQLSNYMTETLQPAIDGTLMFLRAFNAIFTEDLYNVFRVFFQSLMKEFAILNENKEFINMLQRLGRVFANQFIPVLDDLAGKIDYWIANPKEFEARVGRAIKTFGEGMKTAALIIEGTANFISGALAGKESTDSLTSLKKINGQLADFNKHTYKIGQSYRWLIDTIILPLITYLPTIIKVWLAFKALSLVIMSFIKIKEISKAFKTVKDAITVLGVGDKIKMFFGKIRSFFSLLWSWRVPIVNLITKMTPLTAAISGVVSVILLIIMNFDKLKSTLDSLFNWISQKMGWLNDKTGRSEQGEKPMVGGIDIGPIDVKNASSGNGTIAKPIAASKVGDRTIVTINTLNVKADDKEQLASQIINAKNRSMPLIPSDYGTKLFGSANYGMP